MTKFVAIINVTPDSFSDGNLHAGNNLAAIYKALEDGADIIDIGAESTRPFATPITQEEEWARLEPVLLGLKQNLPDLKISLDTRNAKTAKMAAEMGIIGWINDVSGAKDKEIIDIAKQYDLYYILTHNLGVPPHPDINISANEDVIEVISRWFLEKIHVIKNKGCNKIILDPGIGFGKNPRQTFYLLANIEKLQLLGYPLYIGHSRKSFLKILADKPAEQRDAETAIISLFMVKAGIDYLRVHNIAINKLIL